MNNGTNKPAVARDSTFLVRVAVSLALDYFRWMQMAPLILVWAMLLAMSFVLLLAYNEDAAWSLVDLGIRTVQSIPFIGDRFTAWMESQTTNGTFSPDLGEVDWKAFALKTWALISLAFMLLGALLRRLAGPMPPLTLKRKLTVAAAACLVVTVAFAGLVFYDYSGEDAPFFSVMLSAGGMGLVLFVINAWCLSIAHALGWLSSAVMDPDFHLGARNTLP